MPNFIPYDPDQSKSAGLAHHSRSFAQAELYRLDEAACGQSRRQAYLWPPHVRGRTGVWQHYCNEQALKSIQFTRQKESPGAMAAVLSGTQY